MGWGPISLVPVNAGNVHIHRRTVNVGTVHVHKSMQIEVQIP